MGAILLLSGLPGSGKTTLARALCQNGRAVHLRVDTVEQAICESLLAPDCAIDAGYRVAAAQATELALLGHDVVCDAVNADARGRALWPEADLIIHVQVPEACRQERLAQRALPEYPHVWQDWAGNVLTLDGTLPPDTLARTVWSALDP